MEDTVGRDTHDRIVARARALWVAHGFPPDSDAAFLYQATKEIELDDQLVAIRTSELARRGTTKITKAAPHS